MKRLIIISFISIILTGCFNQNSQVNTNIESNDFSNNPTDNAPIESFHPPLTLVKERITKKPFGLKVSPQNSPVKPEIFSGYHTGTDFEIFPEEADLATPVSAICDGKIISARNASGYGGVVIQSCEYNNEPITVVYGHLSLSSLLKEAGEDIKAGEYLANLGDGYSLETDNERKHLHLGIHLGTEINIKGYVQNESELSQWLDYQKINN